MATTSACHILVQTKAEAESLKTTLDTRADCYKLAKRFSTYPSGKQSGDLGELCTGDMVAVFIRPLLKVQGSVKTPFDCNGTIVLYRS